MFGGGQMVAEQIERKPGLKRYRAKASRRPVRFWWQAFATLGITVCLWCGLPVGAVFYNARSFAPLHAPRAAYVVLEPAEALRMLRKARSGWMAGSGGALAPSFALDLGLGELRESLPPPSFMDDGGVLAEGWRPAEVEALPMRLSEAPAPSLSRQARAPFRPFPQHGVRFFPDATLSALSFNVDVEAVKIAEEEGSARFYVETGDDGRVEHVLATAPLSEGAALIERALLRGRANGAGRGFVEVCWKPTRGE